MLKPLYSCILTYTFLRLQDGLSGNTIDLANRQKE